MTSEISNLPWSVSGLRRGRNIMAVAVEWSSVAAHLIVAEEAGMRYMG